MTNQNPNQAELVFQRNDIVKFPTGGVFYKVVTIRGDDIYIRMASGNANRASTRRVTADRIRLHRRPEVG